jgi:phosphodiesterase/alkaline phosphatase D-like protein
VGRTDAASRLAALTIAVCAMVFAPVVFAPVLVGATTSDVPSASGQGSGSAIAPVGKVQAGLVTPGPRQKSSGQHSPPLRTMNPAALRNAKLTADAVSPAGVSASPGTATPSAAAPFNGLNSPGLSAADEGYQPTPPDSTGAIGPTRYVEFVNNLVGVYDRSNLTLLSSTDLGTFTAVPSGLATSDPQIQWDPQGNRWFYGAVGFNSNFTNNYLLFGWSKTADPGDLAGGWCRYASSTGSTITDYPKLGHDANFVTFGDNVYDGSQPGLPFVTADIWAIAKPPASQSTCAGSVAATHFADATHVLKNADGTGAFTPVPANTNDASANGYIVAAHDPSVSPQSKVMVWHVAPGPVLVPNGDISVGSTYGVPPSVPQPGTTYLLDSLDARLTQAVAQFDPSAGAEAVWTQHTVAGSGRSMVRWYELLPGSLAIRQQGQLASATDYYWNAAISPSSAGNDAMISYNRGSSSLLPVIGAQTRTKSTTLGQMDAGEVLVGSSSDADQETLFQGNCTANPCRWGDYSGATPDPLNPGVVWGSNQIVGPGIFGLAQWTTQNYAITTGGTPPTAPTPPTGLSAGAINSSQVSLTWNASSGATSYKVQRSPDGSTGWTQVGTSSTTSSTDSGLNPSTTYFYRVLASNSVGDSGPSNVASATTPAGLAYSQSPQGNWVGVYGADGYALMDWNGGTDLVSLPQSSLVLDQGSRFQWSSGTTAVQALQSPDTTTRRAACFSDGNQIRVHLTFTTAYNGSLHLYALDWDALGRRETITVDDGSGARSATISTDFSLGAWVNAPINVGAGGTVTVSVTRTAGLNAVLSGIFLGGAPVAAAPPTGLNASAVNASQVSLRWNASSGATFYKVQRSPDGSTGWAQVGTSNSTSFTDSGVSPATTYFYRVLASNSVGDSAPSNVASATTPSGLASSQSPQGNWVGVYGADGYALMDWSGSGDLVSLPQSSLVLDQGGRYQWSSGTTAVQALESPDTTTRRAACFYDGNQIRIRLTFTTAYSGSLHLYALDWDAIGRRETVTVDDGSGPRSATISTDFSQGIWVNAPITVAAAGTVTVTVTRTAGLNAVLSGIFLGGAPVAALPPTGLSAGAINSSQISLTWNASSGAAFYKVQRSPDGSTGWAQVGTSNATTFTDSGLSPSTTYFYRVLASNSVGDSAPSNTASATTPAGLASSQSPQGNWVGVYGADGYALMDWTGTGDLVSLPQSSLVLDQGGRYQWSNGTTAVQALESPDTATRRAACFSDGNQIRLRLIFSPAYSGSLHLYALDWDAIGRRETVTVDDGSGPRSATISTDFSQGIWVNAPITVAAGGTVTVTVTRTAGLNAVLSGIFLGGAPVAAVSPTGLSAGALNSSQVSLSWNASSGASSYRVQRSPDGSTGWAQVGTSNTTTFTDSGLSPATTYFYRVLASNSLGDSGPSNVASATTLAGLAYSQSPQGNWVGVYGADGYALMDWSGSGDLVSLPQSSLVLDQGGRYQWSSGTTAVQALESPDTTIRHAACVYDGNQIRIRLTFTTAYSGNLHLYALDWDALGRRETITVDDGSGPRSATISTDFSQGAWVNAPITVAAGGMVTVTVTRTAGLNAVLSGIFLG